MPDLEYEMSHEKALTLLGYGSGSGSDVEVQEVVRQSLEGKEVVLLRQEVQVGVFEVVHSYKYGDAI